MKNNCPCEHRYEHPCTYSHLLHLHYQKYEAYQFTHFSILNHYWYLYTKKTINITNAFYCQIRRPVHRCIHTSVLHVEIMYFHCSPLNVFAIGSALARFQESSCTSANRLWNHIAWCITAGDNSAAKATITPPVFPLLEQQPVPRQQWRLKQELSALLVVRCIQQAARMGDQAAAPLPSKLPCCLGIKMLVYYV